MNDRNQLQVENEEDMGVSHGAEVNDEDEEPCVETGRSLINALLEDSEEADMPSEFVDDVEEESDSEERFLVTQPGSSEINEEIGAVVKMEEGLDAQEWSEFFGPEDNNHGESVPGPSSIDESIAAVAGAIGCNCCAGKTHLDAQNHLQNGLGQQRCCTPPDLFTQVKNEEEADKNTGPEAVNAADILEESAEPGPSTSEEPSPPKKTMGLLTEMWITENCVVQNDFYMPRGEIYAVYVDDLRSKHDSTSFGISVFCQYMTEIFPSVAFRRNGYVMEAVGIRLANPHSLAPSTLKWAPAEPNPVEEQSPVDEEMSDEEDEEGEEEGSPVERLTMRWIKLNCTVDKNITTPRGELYAAYIDDLRNEHCTLSGSLRLFGNVVRRVFPTAQMRRIQETVYIRGVNYVGPHRLHRAVAKRCLAESVLEAKLDSELYQEQGEAPEVKNEDGSTNFMKYCNEEAQFSGAYNGALNGTDSAEVPEKPFPCLECPKAFADSFSLTIHMRQHSRERKAAKANGHSLNLNNHQQMNHAPMDEAGPSEVSLLKYNAHLVAPTIHQGIKAYECPVCGRLCCAPSTLAAHLKVHTRKPTECPTCQKTFKSSAALNGHMRAHKNTSLNGAQLEEPSSIYALMRPFKCEICGSRFKHEASLTVHMYRHTEDSLLRESSNEEIGMDTKDFPTLEPIDDPDSQVPTVGSYLAQILHPTSVALTRVTPPPPSLVCPICHKTSMNAGNLKIHMRRHTGEKPFQCDLCPKRFISKGTMKSHRANHAKKQCGICLQYFLRKRLLRLHIEKEHTKVEKKEDHTKTEKRNIQEDHTKVEKKEERANKKEDHTKTVKRNVQEEHPKMEKRDVQEDHAKSAPSRILPAADAPQPDIGVRKMKARISSLSRNQCIICLRNFKARRSLQTHIRTAHKEKRYQCSMCPMLFTRKLVLQEHIRQEHWQFECSICSTRFEHRPELRTHIREKHWPLENDAPQEDVQDSDDLIGEELSDVKGEGLAVPEES